jgi:ubiquinone/menaquinone biosynthesis C-methylase UbiE
MANPGYDYYGLTADTWDMWRGGLTDQADRNFFRDIIRQYGQPVLDVGCGTGRILLDFLSEGIDIDGVDNSPEMLALCRAKAQRLGFTPQLYQQPMETLDLPRTYRTILVPSSTFQVVTDLEKARNTLRRFLAHLQPGGAFATQFANDWREGEPLDTGWVLVVDQPRAEDGALVRSWCREWCVPEEQVWHTEQHFEIELNGIIIQADHHYRSPEGRWYSQTQAIQILRDAGFTDVQLFREYTHEPALKTDRLFCAIGVKP